MQVNLGNAFIVSVIQGPKFALRTYLMNDWCGVLVRQIQNILHVLDAEVTDAHAVDNPFLLGVADRFPAFLTRYSPSDGAVHEIKINVPKSAFLD